MKTMGERIRDRLKELKKSQRWLAKLVGMQQPSLNVVINGLDGQSTKHVVAIAHHLGVNAEWLEFGRGDKFPATKGEAVLVGYIGAGDKVFRSDDVLEGGIEPPAGYTAALAARIRGESMRPLEPGWLVFYAEESGDAEKFINRLCAVGLADGAVYIKKVRKIRGKWRLESWNADPIENAAVAWASPIIEIRPK